MKAALLGYGWWGQHIARRLNGHETIELTGVFAPELDPDTPINDLPVYPSEAAAISDPCVEAVILTTPNPAHESQVLGAADAGKHFYCEKPLSLTGDSARRMVRAMRAKGLTLGIGHERRFEPAMQTLEKMVSSGALGTVMHAEAAFSHDKLATLEPGNWRTQKSISPAAGMTGMGIHLTDFFIWMFGPIETVQAITADRTLGWETGDVVTAQFRFRAGNTGTLSAILNTPHFMRYHVFGSKKWAEVRNDTHPDTPGGQAHLEISETGAQIIRQAFPWTDTVLGNLEAFAQAVDTGAPYPFTDHQLVHNIEVLEAIAQSAESGKTVSIPA
ncbi:MAG: Gfo/Idh/MocA family oxidoreductase [Rhodobacter sp.]|nr:Gfo/Idh/MocA family oxidoreductase [Rhodobacter sp.]